MAEEWLARLKDATHEYIPPAPRSYVSTRDLQKLINAYEERGKRLHLACEALFPEPEPKELEGMEFHVTHDAAHNLEGVLADISRDPNSAVNQRTINRVLAQLETARAHINKETPNG